MDVAMAVKTRWSPRKYVPEPIEDAVLKDVFEAGRAAHSCFNEQPWRFLFAKKNAGKDRLTLEALLDKDNAYAKEAWILGISFGKKNFTLNHKPNRHHGHDVGAASQLMSLRAHSLGLGMRFMAGFDVDKARELVPEEFEPYAMFVIGRIAPDVEKKERSRKPLAESVFENRFGQSWSGA